MEKNKDLEKIKLMFNYDVKKTLNENINELKPSDVDEQVTKIAGEELGALKAAFEDAFKASKDLRSVEILGANGEKTIARNTDELMKALKDGKITSKTLAQVNSGLLKSVKTPPNVIDVIIQNPAFDKKFATQYGSLLRDEAQLTAQLKSKGYPDEVIQKMISRAKGEKSVVAKSGAKQPKTNQPVKGKDGQIVTGNNNVVAKGDIHMYAKDVQQGEAVGNLTKLPEDVKTKPNVVEASTAAEKAVKDMPPSRFQKLKEWALKNKLKTGKYLLYLGLAGGAAWGLYKLLSGKSAQEDVDDSLANNCLGPLVDSGEATLLTSNNGDLVIGVKNTGNPEYDSKGGLQFYTNHRVMTTDMSKKGTWECKGSKLATIAEQSAGGEVSQQQMTTFVDDAVDDLDGYVAVYNLESLKNIVTQLKGKTYKGKPAFQAFLEYYKEDEGGDDFVADIESVGVKTLGVEGIELKKELLNMIKRGVSDSNTTTSNKVEDLVTIKWDGDTEPVKTGGDDSEPKPQPKKSNFHDCSSKDFPFEVGCISPKIAEIQKCLGVEPQKGYLGPKTISALINLHFETKDGLTKDVYDKVIAACKESEPKPTEAPKTDGKPVETPKTDNPATAPITPPATPAEPVYDKNRLQELLASKNLVKKRKGVIIKWKGPELSGEDYYILNKYLEDQGYIQKKQRETGDRDDEDVTMKYKWKRVGEE